MKITTGPTNYQILETGTVISFKDEVINFFIADDVRISMRFEINKSAPGQKMDFVQIDNNALEIVLTNFNGSLGSGNASPLALARINGKQVYLNFIVHALDETSNKTVHYTWYIREDVA